MGLSNLIKLFGKKSSKAAQAEVFYPNQSASFSARKSEPPVIESIRLYDNYDGKDNQSREVIKANNELQQFLNYSKKLSVNFEQSGFMPHAFINDEYVGVIRKIRRMPGNIALFETSFLRIDDTVCYYADMDMSEISSRVYLRKYAL